MKLEAVIDRFENDKAILIFKTDSEIVYFPKKLLPPKAREGDILSFSVKINKELTETSRLEIKKLIDELAQNSEELKRD
ncbi:MAG: DUF3006 domain-containing protein [Actinobacteria bacterium]|nr:DUF3006 domain-containing protein [Actinomycetota bacterium]